MEYTPGHVIEGTPGPDGGAWPALIAKQSWDGWAVPYFTKETAIVLAAALDVAPGTKARFDEAQDAVVVITEEMEDPEEVFSGTDIDGARMYSICGYSWTWSRVHLASTP